MRVSLQWYFTAKTSGGHCANCDVILCIFLPWSNFVQYYILSQTAINLQTLQKFGTMKIKVPVVQY